jgi:adenylylsulfate kinase
LSFRPEDRAENIRRIGEMVKLFVDAGIIVLTAFISPYRKDRRIVRSLLEYGQFLEIYVDCAVEECAKRDKKGIYEKAKAGIIKNFTGISAPYEPPYTPELVIKSHEEDARTSAAKVIELIEEYKIIQPHKSMDNGQSKVG